MLFYDLEVVLWRLAPKTIALYKDGPPTLTPSLPVLFHIWVKTHVFSVLHKKKRQRCRLREEEWWLTDWKGMVGSAFCCFCFYWSEQVRVTSRGNYSPPPALPLHEQQPGSFNAVNLDQLSSAATRVTWLQKHLYPKWNCPEGQMFLSYLFVMFLKEVWPYALDDPALIPAVKSQNVYSILPQNRES
jgi:hypothetical protein